MTVIADRAFLGVTESEAHGLRSAIVVFPAGPLARELSQHMPPSWSITHAADDPKILSASAFPAAAVIVDGPFPRRMPDSRARSEPLREGCSMRAAARVCAISCSISSTAIYGATPHHAGLATEESSTARAGQSVARAWHALEAQAVAAFGAEHVTILRAAPVLVAGSTDFFSALLASRDRPDGRRVRSDTAVSDRGGSRARVNERSSMRIGGRFNIVPAAPIPLRAALRLAGRRHSRCRGRFIVFCTQCTARGFCICAPAAVHPLSLDGVGRSRRPSVGISRAVYECAMPFGLRWRLPPSSSGLAGRSERFDAFGMDRGYIDSGRGAVAWAFLHRHYWRVEACGIDTFR